jgi:hypothetical protein
MVFKDLEILVFWKGYNLAVILVCRTIRTCRENIKVSDVNILLM